MDKKVAYKIQRIIFEEKEKQGMSSSLFCELAGCDRRQMRRWKSHETGMTIDSADRALKALGITVTIGK